MLYNNYNNHNHYDKIITKKKKKYIHNWKWQFPFFFLLFLITIEQFSSLISKQLLLRWKCKHFLHSFNLDEWCWTKQFEFIRNSMFDDDSIWLTHRSFGYNYRAVVGFHCLLRMVLMIVCQHWFAALNCFPLVMLMVDSNANRNRIFDRQFRQRCRYHLMRSIVVVNCFAVECIDCRDQLWMLDSEENERIEDGRVNNRLRWMNANSSSLHIKINLRFFIWLCLSCEWQSILYVYLLWLWCWRYRWRSSWHLIG